MIINKKKERENTCNKLEISNISRIEVYRIFPSYPRAICPGLSLFPANPSSNSPSHHFIIHIR